MTGPVIGTLVPVGAGTVHVREDGPADGHPVVLLHGFCGSLHWFSRVVPLLADTFRVIRLDLLGHGSTGGHAADAPEQARMVSDVLGRLGVTDATVVGHSFGADVAVELAERDDRIRDLVIVTQAPDYSDANLPSGGVIMTVPVLAPVLHRAAAGLFALLVRTRAVPTGNRELAAYAVRDFRALDTGMFRVILTERNRRMQQRPLDAQLTKPTLAILGGRDHFYGARAAGRYESAGARVEILADSGHSPTVEMPGRTAQLIRDFARRDLTTSLSPRG